MMETGRGAGTKTRETNTAIGAQVAFAANSASFAITVAPARVTLSTTNDTTS